MLLAPAPGFVCVQKRELLDESFVVRVQHRLGGPAAADMLRSARKLTGLAGKSLCEFYAMHDGMTLFEESGTKEAGFRFLPIRQWVRATKAMHKWARLAADGVLPEDFKTAVVFAEVPGSENWYAIQTVGSGMGSIRFYDHETVELAPAAENFVAFLDLIGSTNPVALLNEMFGCFTRYRNPATKEEGIVESYNPQFADIRITKPDRIRMRGEPYTFMVPSGWEPPSKFGHLAMLRKPDGTSFCPVMGLEVGPGSRPWGRPEDEIRLLLKWLEFASKRFGKPRRVQVGDKAVWQCSFTAKLDCRTLPERKIWRLTGRVLIAPVEAGGWKALCYATTKKKLQKIEPDFCKLIGSVQYDKCAAPLPPPVKRASLSDLICRGDLKGIKRALKAGTDPNEVDDQGQSALNRAIEKGWLSAMKMLLARGADPNLTPRFSWPPIQRAVQYGGDGFAMIRLLLKNKADPNSTGVGGRTPLYESVIKYQISDRPRYRRIIQLLLKNGANPNLGGKNDSALAYVQRNRLIGLIPLLRRSARNF
jgi:hypothetical protein